MSAQPTEGHDSLPVVQTTDEEVVTCTRRIEREGQSPTERAWAVELQGHPDLSYNGLYAHHSTSEGWPVLKNAAGVYCYRHTPRDQWLLRDKLTPKKPNCNACIVEKDGALPTGTRTWMLAPTAVGRPKGTHALIVWASVSCA